MLIENSSIKKGCMSGKNILLTGSGGGIGFEAARALVWMGARVIIAEIDKDKGLDAEKRINEETGSDLAEFYEIDLSDEGQLRKMAQYIKDKYVFLDVVFNNATITPFGTVEEVDIEKWDRSYAVNFRAPLLLTQIFLPEMRARNSGTLVFVPSSGAAPYMGAYEVFKTTQVELCNTLTGELEGTGINTYSIGPGLVRTETAQNGIKTVAGLMGMSEDEFYRMNENHILGVEEAGTGFAISVLYAGKYRGQEIGSIQVLSDAGLLKNTGSLKNTGLLKNSASACKEIKQGNTDELAIYLARAAKTYEEQYNGWQERNLFERQWVMRDFKKSMGCSTEQFKDKFSRILLLLQEKAYEELAEYKTDFEKLIGYYQHQYKLLQGYEKNPETLKKNSDIISQWIHDVQKICDDLG